MCCKGPPTGISVTRWANGAALHPLTKPHRTKTSSFRLMTPFHLLRPRQHHRLAAVFHLKARRSLRRSVRAHGPFPKSPDHTSQRGLQPAESHRNQRHGSRPVTATRASQNRGSDRFYRWLQQLRRAWGFFFFGAPFTWEHRTGGTVGGQRNSPPRCGTSQNSPGASAAPRRTGLPRSYPRILPDGDETLRFHLAARPFHTQTPPPSRLATTRSPHKPGSRCRPWAAPPPPSLTAGAATGRGSDGPGRPRATAPQTPPPHPAPAATVARLSPGEGGGRPGRPRLRAGAAAAPWRERSRRRHSEAAAFAVSTAAQASGRAGREAAAHPGRQRRHHGDGFQVSEGPAGPGSPARSSSRCGRAFPPALPRSPNGALFPRRRRGVRSEGRGPQRRVVFVTAPLPAAEVTPAPVAGG